MKVSFNEAVNEQPTEESQALATRPDLAPAVAAGTEEIDRSDLVTPTLNVVAKVGDLSNQFNPGSIVLDKTIELVQKDQPLHVIAVRITKSYQEDTEFGEEMGERANTLAEVRAKGGQIEDSEDENYWISVARIIFLVKLTDVVNPDAASSFFYEIGGESYLLAQMYVRKSAYTGVAKPLFSLKLARGSESAVAYNMVVGLSKFNGNTWFKPTLRPAGKPSEAVVEFLKNNPL